MAVEVGVGGGKPRSQTEGGPRPECGIGHNDVKVWRGGGRPRSQAEGGLRIGYTTGHTGVVDAIDM